MLHLFMHSSVPQLAPVPMGGTAALVLSLAKVPPKAALTYSDGKPLVKTAAMFNVPASSLVREETS